MAIGIDIKFATWLIVMRYFPLSVKAEYPNTHIALSYPDFIASSAFTHLPGTVISRTIFSQA
jgi:hypothetical protein